MLIHKTLEIPSRRAGADLLRRARSGSCGTGCSSSRPRAASRFGGFWGGGLCLGAADHVHAEVAVRPSRHARGSRALDVGGQAARVGSPGRLRFWSCCWAWRLPAVVTWLAFARRGGGTQFIYDNFILNAHWQWHSGRHLLKVAHDQRADPAPVSRRRALRAGAPQPRPGASVAATWCSCARSAGLIAGLAVVPAAYEQYYLPLLAIACLFAARGLSVLLDLRRSREPRPGRLLVCATVLPADLASRRSRPGPWPAGTTCRWRGCSLSSRTPALPIRCWTDGWVRTCSGRILSTTSSCTGSCRSRSPNARSDAYVDALTSGKVRPALIALDDELRALGPRFLQFVQHNYVSDDGVLYLPVQPASSPTAAPHAIR